MNYNKIKVEFLLTELYYGYNYLKKYAQNLIYINELLEIAFSINNKILQTTLISIKREMELSLFVNNYRLDVFEKLIDEAKHYFNTEFKKEEEKNV